VSNSGQYAGVAAEITLAYDAVAGNADVVVDGDALLCAIESRHGNSTVVKDTVNQKRKQPQKQRKCF